MYTEPVRKESFNFILLLLIVSCAFSGSQIKQDPASYSNFFLCFPETDIEFSKLSNEDKMKIKKKIGEERRERNFNCSEYSNFVSGRENINKINEEIFKDKTSPCRKIDDIYCEAR